MLTFFRKNWKDMVWLAVLIAAGYVLLRFVILPTSAGKEGKMQMPEQMKELAEEETVEWMAGMRVDLPECTRRQEDIAANVDSYLYTGDVIHAALTLQNGLIREQEYFLMLLADGIPMEFNVGEETVLAYPVNLKDSVYLEISFLPVFERNLGRLDFLLFYDENPESDYHMMSYTVWMEQPEENEKPLVFQETIAQREGLEDSFKGNTYGAWLWKASALPSSLDNIGPKAITAESGEMLLLEVVAAGAGEYRTLLIAGRNPVFIDCGGTVHEYLDWESDGSNMLQIPFCFPDNVQEKFSFFTVTTPLGENHLVDQSMASPKIVVHHAAKSSPERKE